MNIITKTSAIPPIPMSEQGVPDHRFPMDDKLNENESNVFDEKVMHALEKIMSQASPAEQDRGTGLPLGFGPLSHLRYMPGKSHTAFAGEMQPGVFKSVADRKIANPAPLGLCGFALSTFVLSLINIGTLDLRDNSILICLGLVYGGLIQILVGMWEMAVGNTFGATTFSSYGAFWISYAILLTPKGFDIMGIMRDTEGGHSSLQTVGIYYFGWFIFTTLMTFCTLKSTIAMFILFFCLDMSYLFSGVSFLYNNGTDPQTATLRASGWFGIVAAFAAWYSALAGVADNTNSFFILPAIYFPWTSGARLKKNDEEQMIES